MTTVLTEKTHAGAFIIAELDYLLSRTSVMIGANQDLPAGSVLGRTGAASGAPVVVSAPVKKQGFVGAGGLTLHAAPAYDAAAVNEGTYRIVCKTVAAGGGVFSVTDPLGNALADATEGAAYTTEIKFQIDATGTDFAVGDEFDVTVRIDDTIQTGEYVVLAPAGSGGAEIAQAVLIYPMKTDTVPQKAAVIFKQARLRGSDLSFPAGITIDQKGVALSQLNDRGIQIQD